MSAARIPRSMILWLQSFSINRHSSAHCASRARPIPIVVIRHLRHVMVRELLLFTLQLPPRDVWFQAMAEVGRAHASVDDGEDDQDDRNDGKGG